MHMLDEIYAEFYYLEKGKQIIVLISLKEWTILYHVGKSL